MKDRHVILLAMGREFGAWKKPFLISSAIVLAVVAIGMTALALTGSNGPVTFELGLVDEPPADISQDVESLLHPDARLSITRYPSLSEAESALANREVDALVVGDDEVVWGASTTDRLADAVWLAVSNQQVRSTAASLGLTPDEADRLIFPDIESRRVESPEEGSVADVVMATLAVILMFMSILAYGQWIGYAVVEEKANRVVELLLGAIKPHQLMAAKVLSIGLLGLTQIAAMGGLALAIGLATDRVEIPPASGSVVVWILIWFLLGYAFYGSLYAAAGSLASTSQEAGSVIGPMSILATVGYVFGLITMAGGIDTLLLRVASFIPLSAPMLMPARIARGWAESWEIAISLGVMVAAGLAMIYLAGRIYMGGMARATSRLGWREAFRTGSDLKR